MVCSAEVKALSLSSSGPLVMDRGLRTFPPKNSAGPNHAGGRRAGYAQQGSSVGALLGGATAAGTAAGRSKTTPAPPPATSVTGTRRGSGDPTLASKSRAQQRNIVTHRGDFVDAHSKWHPTAKPVKGPPEGRAAPDVDNELHLSTGGKSRRMSFAKEASKKESGVIETGVSLMDSHFTNSFKTRSNKKHVPEPRHSLR